HRACCPASRDAGLHGAFTDSSDRASSRADTAAGTARRVAAGGNRDARAARENRARRTMKRGRVKGPPEGGPYVRRLFAFGNVGAAFRRPAIRESRLGWTMALPALSVIALIALGPVLWAVWESLYLHDLRMPWLGRRFIGVQNYIEAFSDPRFWEA